MTDASGNIVKVTVPKGTPVTKSVSTGLGGVRPGDTVVIRGQTKSGAVTATSVAVGGVNGGLFGGGAGSLGGADGNSTSQR